MRILCLHGYGTSGRILESQLSVFMSRADPNIEFVFLDGENECQKAQGVGNFVQGPFLCYNDSFAPADVHRSCELVREFIETDGPFDGVLGFSQGGSLALTYLLQHEIERPTDRPPFKFAMLFSTVVAFSADETFGNDILDSLTAEEIRLLENYPNCDLSKLGMEKRALCETTAKAFQSAKIGGFIAKGTNSGSFSGKSDPLQPRILHPILLKERIRIPTVHITGKRDDRTMVDLSILMRELCDRRLRKILTHSGAHDVPRREEDVKAAWREMEWAIQQSQRQAW